MKFERAILCAVLFYFFMPFVAAYWSPSLYWLSPDYFLSSLWFKFGIAFALFYALVFFAVSKVFHNEKPVAIVVAFVVALLISYSLLVRGFLDFYASSNLIDWVIVFAFLILLAVLARFLYTRTSKTGAIIALIALWALLFLVYTNEAVPFYSLPSGLHLFFELATGPIGIMAVFLLALVIALRKKKKPEIHLHAHGD